MAGLPGTGKSTIANALATELGSIVFDKDRVRAALFPEPWIEYSAQQDDFVIDLLLQSAAWLLRRPRVPPFIFMDGRVFAARQQIEHVMTWAHHSGCPVKIIQTTCSDATAFRRLSSMHHPARNRNYDLYLELKSRFDPIEHAHLKLDTDQLLELIVPASLSYLRDSTDHLVGTANKR
jgi:predicted kinase